MQNNGIVYIKADDESVAKCYKEFFIDVLKSGVLFSIQREKAVKHIIKGLSNESTYRQSINGADAEFEQVLADILMNNYKNASTAEDLNLPNAMGYDIIDRESNIFIEAKLYSVSSGGGRISAKVGNLDNKFCSVIVLVIDPYLLGDKKYKLYLIPASRIPSDASSSINIVHHYLQNIDDKTYICKQAPEVGAIYADCAIDIKDLISKIDVFKEINIKKLAACLSKLKTLIDSNLSTTTSKNEFDILYEVWTKYIRLGNKRAKVKFSLDFNNPMYTLNVDHRLISRGATISKIQIQDSNDDKEIQDME